ncbi:hypothetical protein NW755_006636 [Fusarium falciforme]|uniref:Uncharacterized protein n=1 Tax=Fusarium falciforme TaxID=195108 RepID=A0A9W8R987_9HYPO|nr:hypothetical protein NW755_006636 [Fusarium falciforme]
MSNPIDEPESFDILGLDPSKRPFPKPDWLKSGEKVRLEAVDLMMEHWAERNNRIIKHGQASEREHHLDRVSAALINIPTAKVYIAIILLSIWNKRGDRRVEVDGGSFVPNGSIMSDVGADDSGSCLWAGSLRMQ